MTNEERQQIGHECVAKVWNRLRYYGTASKSQTQLERELWRPLYSELLTKKQFRQLYQDAKREWLRHQLRNEVTAKGSAAADMILDGMVDTLRGDDATAIIRLKRTIRSVQSASAESIATELIKNMHYTAASGGTNQ
jgi:hypothetical protein